MRVAVYDSQGRSLYDFSQLGKSFPFNLDAESVPSIVGMLERSLAFAKALQAQGEPFAVAERAS